MPKPDAMVLQALEKLDQKLDRQDSRLDSIEKIQVKQEANLGEHMRRTGLVEENVELLRKEFKPVQKHVMYVEGTLKFLGGLATIILVAEGAISIFHFFHP